MFSMSEIAALLEGFEPPSIQLDNATCHRKIQERFPNTDIKFLPPWSLFSNPIENCFSTLKAHFSLNDVADTCSSSCRQVNTTIEDCTPIFNENESVSSNYIHAKSI